MNGYIVPYETGLCILLFRFMNPTRFRGDMESFFTIRRSKLHSVVTTFTGAVFRYATPFFVGPQIYVHRFPYYAQLINNTSNGAATNIWGFIDGTLRRSCRPIEDQRVHFSGHKRSHGIKFQSVVTPDGLITCLFGPVPGSRHDSHLLAESNLLPQLRALMPPGHPVYAFYGDSAYPQSRYLIGGFRLG
jgi:nuclease HARBI1